MVSYFIGPVQCRFYSSCHVDVCCDFELLLTISDVPEKSKISLLQITRSYRDFCASGMAAPFWEKFSGNLSVEIVVHSPFGQWLEVTFKRTFSRSEESCRSRNHEMRSQCEEAPVQCSISKKLLASKKCPKVYLRMLYRDYKATPCAPEMTKKNLQARELIVNPYSHLSCVTAIEIYVTHSLHAWE